MLFLEPTESAWDLRWRMFGIPVRVHPMFWLVTLIMGSNTLKMGVEFLLLWIACVFVSILIHELGHVVMGMVFGTRGHIVLYGFGGLAVGSNQLDKRWQRMAVSLAGPMAGFLFLGAVFAVLWLRNPGYFPVYVEFLKADLGLPFAAQEALQGAAGPIDIPHPMEFFTVLQLIFINMLWGLVNLLPVWPLDGGQISRDACEGVSPPSGLKVSLGISLVTAGLLALHSVMAMNDRPLLPLRFGSMYSALLFGLLALQSFQLLQQAHIQSQQSDDHWHGDDR
jgi:stage IV sporulation protein FB